MNRLWYVVIGVYVWYVVFS